MRTPPPAPELGASPVTPGLVGSPLRRLVIPGNPVEALVHPLPEDRLTALGVREYHAFTATAPQIWLLAFRFDHQNVALERVKDLGALVGPEDGPPYHRVVGGITGGWLLVTGFPGDKPVSPEMEYARNAFLGAFAGEE